MPYVTRDADGVITSLHVQPEGRATEFLPDEDPAVRGFVDDGNGFGEMDADFILVLEDLIDVLIQRKLINLTDLPADARRKLYSRKGRRHASPLSALGLLGDSESPADDAA
jgi:hypothetical protein